MSKVYNCNLCNKIFNQKIDFTRHQNKKMPCISLSEIQKITDEKIIKTDNKSVLINLFKSCLNILRDNEGLIGEKALRSLSYLLILKLLEHHIGNEIDMDNYPYDFSHIQDDLVEVHKNKLLSILRFSNLSNEKEDSIIININYLWNDILSVHPLTEKIFLKGKGFDIQRQSSLKKIIEKLSSINITDKDYDILGNAYEEVIQDIMTGKVLGQFFTQPLVKKMMVKLIDPKIHEDGKIDTCGDPTMGTGGFLITYLKYILEQAKIKNIKPDWNFIKTEGLYGKEIEPDTYQLAVSNMLISSGHMFSSLEKGDSIRVPITRKFDNILANPPFGIKGLKYDDFESSLKNQYVPIKTDNAVSLFIQAIIYMLKINGKCAVVLPDGQDLFSKSNKTLISIREYLLKTCDLKEIIYLPSGIFTYTSIKTCVFYFIKKREGTDVLETKLKISKSQKEAGRDYKFTKMHQTHKVKFYDYNPYEDIKNLLVEVPIEVLANNYYSLNYAEYMKDESIDEKTDDNIIYMNLDEICNINYGTRIVKSNNTDGEYNVYGSGRAMFTTNSFNRENFNILIGRFALSNECVRLIYEKIFLNDSGLTIKPINENIVLHKFIGYYFYINQNIIYECARGTAQKNLDIDKFKSIKIPIPSLEKQHKIVNYLDFIYDKCIKMSNDKISQLKELNKLCLNNQKEFGKNVIKILEEVCEIEKNLKKYDTSYGKSKGKYKFHTGGERTDLYVDECDIKELYIIQNRTNGSGKCNLYLDKNFSLAKQTISYRALNKHEITTKYIYYYLLFNKEILEKGFVGANHKNISKEYISNIQIYIPSLKRQKEIVDYCEKNDILIKQLEEEIKENKKQAIEFLSMVLDMEISEPISETIKDDEEEIKSEEDKLMEELESLSENDTETNSEQVNSEDDNESKSVSSVNSKDKAVKIIIKKK
jgi:type I restriction-modification system DNA methylase subunit/restriction endonuclease S subunit